MKNQPETSGAPFRSKAATMPQPNGGAILLFLLALWVANIAFFFVYFVKLGWTRLY